ncbi:MAG: hypothetical protein GF418_09470 [Chitinivibrionales bacterium]|nr:hypothetical protein [Chitinivibrionales bacterium]MBD3395838.1 hypothetical protein [Chitinivibrionales bacterium]
MIVPMKKLTVLLYHRQKEELLQALGDAGVVHVVEKVAEPAGELAELAEKSRRIERVAGALKRRMQAGKLSPEQQQADAIDALLDAFEKLESRRDALEQDIAALRKDAAVLSPWGDFDPQSFARLAEAGIRIRFFEAARKAFDALDKDAHRVEVVAGKGPRVLFVVVQREGEERFDKAEEVVLPGKSLSAIQQEIDEKEEEAREAGRSLDELCAYADAIGEQAGKLRVRESFETARQSMEDAVDGRVAVLEGWVPDHAQKDAASFLDGFAAWYEFAPPSPDDDVPVCLRNKTGLDLFEPVTKIFSLPSYFELDPTPFFAPFFALFFGLCLSDAGYGLILTVLGMVAMRFVSKTTRPLMLLLTVLGLATVAGGVMLNTFFGQAIFAAPGFENALFENGDPAALLRPAETPSGSMYFPAIPLSVYLGVIQIIIGMLMKAYNRSKMAGVVYALHPIAEVIMVAGVTLLLARINFLEMGAFTFGAIPVGPALMGLPAAAAWILMAAGCALMFVFNNPDKSPAARFGLGFWELYQFGTGLMADGLSYLRLFALGLGTGLLGSAFNQIAFMLITTEDGTRNYFSPLILGTIVILIGGHGINLALSGLGSFVHPLRLTFVEFYKNLDFKGGAKPYQPLRGKDALTTRGT